MSTTHVAVLGYGCKVESGEIDAFDKKVRAYHQDGRTFLFATDSVTESQGAELANALNNFDIMPQVQLEWERRVRRRAEEEGVNVEPAHWWLLTWSY